MNNPWRDFAYNTPYILKSDLDHVNNRNLNTRSSNFIIHTDLLPEPYFGNILYANIVLLGLNPGVSDDARRYECMTDYFVTTHKKNLLHENQDYPFYLLDPHNHLAPGHEWWMNKFKPLLKNGISIENISKKICCLEFFPYHSKQYKHNVALLNSQKYNFFLLERAILRNAIIIVMRSENYWIQNSIPLYKYKNSGNYFKLNSCQNVIISSKNLGFENFKKILSALV